MTPQPELAAAAAAHKATGPTTPEGKARASLNALRHGLTGQTVLMPWEDQAAYKSHCDTIVASLAPASGLETQIAQAIADDHWRLNRARAVDTNMFALGHFDHAPETGHSQIDAAIASARAFRDYSKVFVNLSLYEQRINRSLEKNLARLEALQQERRTQDLNRRLEEGMARGDAIREKVMREHEARMRPEPNPGAALDPANSRSGLIPTASEAQQPTLVSLIPTKSEAQPESLVRSGLIPTKSEAQPKTPGQESVYASTGFPIVDRFLDAQGLGPNTPIALRKAV